MSPKPVILAIDDVPVNLKTLAAALSAEYDLQVASSGAEGLALAGQAAPDLILLDIMMPQMDGYEVCRRLREHPRLCHVPVVFITASTESEAESTGLELGATDFLTKPINVPIARLRIRNILEREALRKEVQAHRDRLEEQVRQRTESLSIAKEAADGANRLKSAILGNMSHELRTPMNGVLGMIAIARRRIKDVTTLNYLAQADASARRLLGRLTALIDFALAASVRLTLERTRFDLAEVIERACEGVRPEATSKGLRIEVTRPAESSEAATALMGDPMRLEQILKEMLDNAVKFSHQGRITVGARLDAAADQTLWLELSVQDEGIGIEPAEQALVFAPFHQADASASRRYGGNGIGLALCHQLVSLMGGTIRVDSAAGEGATFTVRVPVERHDAAAAEILDVEVLETQLRARHAGARVLVVETDRATQTLIRTILELIGLSVSVASAGAEATHQARATPFDLILIERVLPDMSATALVEALRALPGADHTGLAIITDQRLDASALPGDPARAPLQLLKPVAYEGLLDAVLKGLDRVGIPA